MSIKAAFARDFVTFLNEAVTPYHAVRACATRLTSAGFTQLFERDNWALSRGGRYFFTRGDTCLIAFSVGNDFATTSNDPGFYTVLGAHTDSPCLRVKPVATITKSNALMLNTQPYGGGLWHTWFDRDLSIAGRAVLKVNECGSKMETRLFHVKRPIARIPTLAIHLSDDRSTFSPNLHEHCKALLTMDPKFMSATHAEGTESDTASRIHPALLAMVASEISVPVEKIVDLDIQLVDTQESAIGGPTDDFIYSGRLDNLCSTYQSLRAVIDASDEETRNVRMAMLFDHEEVGSCSAVGAGSSLFMDCIKRIHEIFVDGTSSSLMRALRNSFVVSADMAHALHPNYSGKHDASMAPTINGGMVIKHHCNQRYATDQISATMFRRMGKMADIPVQEFSVRADSACGSTIGPIIATLSGVLTVDCGSPQFSMHSIREMMGSEDAYNGYAHLKAALELHPTLMENIVSK